MAKRYILYLIRWQLSTPILALSMMYFHFGVTWNTILANLIGGLIFFWVDRYIFRSKNDFPLLEVATDVTCEGCNLTVKRGYRAAQMASKHESTSRGFRCETCS